MAKRSISWMALVAEKLDVTEEWRKEHPEFISVENSARALLEKINFEKEALQLKMKKKQKNSQRC